MKTLYVKIKSLLEGLRQNANVQNKQKIAHLTEELTDRNEYLNSDSIITIKTALNLII